MSTEAAPTIEAPDTSAPATTETPALLGKSPQETFRNAMKAEADKEGARSAKADPDVPITETTSPTTAKPAPAKSPETVKSSADDIPESLLKPSAPKTETPTTDALPELHGNVSEKTRDHFKKQGEYYTNKLNKAGEEMAALRKELETAKGTNGQPSAEHLSALEAIKKERDDYLARLERVAYQESPAFQEKFTAREERLRGVAEKIFEDVGADKAILTQALAMSGKRRDEFLDEQELGPTTKARLASVLGQLDVLTEERTADIATSREKLAAWRAEEAAKARASNEQLKTKLSSLVEQTLKTAVAEWLPFRKEEGKDEWNAGVDERIALVNKIVHEPISDEAIVEYAFAAAGAKVVDRLNKKLTERLAAAEAKIAGMSATEPGLNGRDKPPASDEERIAKMSPDERARHTFRQLAAPYVGH